jgi:hypothetical protein
MASSSFSVIADFFDPPPPPPPVYRPPPIPPALDDWFDDLVLQEAMTDINKGHIWSQQPASAGWRSNETMCGTQLGIIRRMAQVRGLGSPAQDNFDVKAFNERLFQTRKNGGFYLWQVPGGFCTRIGTAFERCVNKPTANVADKYVQLQSAIMCVWDPKEPWGDYLYPANGRTEDDSVECCDGAVQKKDGYYVPFDSLVKTWGYTRWEDAGY